MSIKQSYLDKGNNILFPREFTILPINEAYLLALILDAEGNPKVPRHPDIPTYFKFSKSSAAKKLQVVNNTCEEYFHHLEMMGLIKREVIQLPGKPRTTYVELQNDALEVLHKLYICSKIDYIYVQKLNIYMFKNLLYIYSKIEQTYIQKIEQYNNNTNNSTNNGVIEQTQDVLLEEKQKNKIYSDPDNATYKSVTAPRAWFRACRDKWGEELTYKKVDILDKYLTKYPDQRKWILGRDLTAFVNGVNEAYRVLNYTKEDRFVEV